MPIQEIPKSQWKDVLDQFSRGHHGQQATIDTTRSTGGTQAQSRSLPLLGVTLEHQDQAIAIVAGDPEGVHFSHAIAHPVHLRLGEWNDGVSGLLEIESDDRTITSIHVGPEHQVLPPGIITDGLYERD